MAISKIKSAGISTDSLSASQLAPNSVGSSELADNAVDVTAIAANAVTTVKILDDNITAGKIATGAVVADGIATGAVVADGIASNAITAAKLASTALASVEHVKPHIQPGTLYPSYVASGTSNKLLDGTTAHGSNGSTAFGTEQADGRKYYYTNINGSKPIKDPRIGAHFGSQRHKFKSMQHLEQESALAGHPVSSVDGREWIRTHGASWFVQNDGNGNQIGNHDGAQPDANDWIEITGYFNKVNWLALILSNSSTNVNVLIDGVSKSTSFAPDAAVNSPLLGRFVDGSSLQELPVGTLDLGIHTLKIGLSTTYWYANGCELIAQDTASNVRRNHVNIPAQNVISYGKKFSVGSDTLTNVVHKHHNPFAFKTDGSTAWASGDHNLTAWPIGTGSSTKIHIATSLGLENWKHSNNYYKPYNGGRVVKWVDTDGTIQTSVNMMPPNARSIANSNSLANGGYKANASIANNTFYPTFEAPAIDSSQAEVAKTFHMREFGNGAANGLDGGANEFADATMVGNAPDDVAYVMDDGLTTHSAGGFSSHTGFIDFYLNNAGQNMYIIFIGTGISLERDELSAEVGVNAGIYAQNLPYGTHIFKYKRGSGSNNNFAQIDGVTLSAALTGTGFFGGKYVTFHQPKMPPIPENAVILSDYMLMADFVKQTDAEDSEISKGVRYNSGSRDHYYSGTSAAQAIVHHAARSGVTGGHTPGGGVHGVWNLPFFGTTGLVLCEGSDAAHTIKLGGSSTTKAALDCSNGTVPARNDVMSLADSNAVALGQTSIETTLLTGGHGFYGHYVASPIHTSSHYQTFKTPFLHELVGGDRNMEQTNLVVTPDGKTWDEVTRDVGYIGQTVVNVNGSQSSGALATSAVARWKLKRGSLDAQNFYIKDSFVMAYDRLICLIAGEYLVSSGTIIGQGAAEQSFLLLNGTMTTSTYTSYSPTHSYFRLRNEMPLNLKKGDYIQVKGGHWSPSNIQHSQFTIVKLK